MEQQQWLDLLASDAPAPGGGGASALVGSVAASLGSMVANLTRGKPKYAAYEQEILQTLSETEAIRKSLYDLIQADADAFVPLSRAYGIPKDDPTRAEKLESALHIAAEPPMDMLSELAKLPPLLETLAEKGSRLALSDVGCAASFCSAAACSAYLNLLVNTRLFAERDLAEKLEQEASAHKEAVVSACERIFYRVQEILQTRKTT